MQPYAFSDVDEFVALPVLATALHNLRIVLILVGGGFLLGVPTSLTAFWNGFQTGALFAGTSPPVRMALLVHGVPELAGQFCATVAGLELVRQVVGRVVYERASAWRPVARWTLAAITLTVFAAGLESRLTPAIGKTLFR